MPVTRDFGCVLVVLAISSFFEPFYPLTHLLHFLCTLTEEVCVALVGELNEGGLALNESDQKPADEDVQENDRYGGPVEVGAVHGNRHSRFTCPGSVATPATWQVIWR
jgi:hypothetical protein